MEVSTEQLGSCVELRLVGDKDLGVLYTDGNRGWGSLEFMEWGTGTKAQTGVE